MLEDDNFITKTEFNRLLKFLDNIKTETLNTGIPKAFTSGIDNRFYTYIKKILDPVLVDKIGDYKIHTAMFLREFSPWAIHTDYNKGDDNPGFAVLIPLETVESHTVIFNEICTDVFETFKKENKQIDNNARYLHETLLSHISIDDLKYVSVKAIEKWQERKLIIWDRNLLHTSDNFLKNNIKEKKAIVIFTSR